MESARITMCLQSLKFDKLQKMPPWIDRAHLRIFTGTYGLSSALRVMKRSQGSAQARCWTTWSLDTSRGAQL